MAGRQRVVVLGLGRFGAAVATTLYEIGHEVLAVDVNRRIVQEISERVTHAVQADATDEDTLRHLGVANFDVAIVGVSESIERQVLITVHLKRLGVPFIVAKVQTELHGDILERIGADRVVLPEREVGVRLAHSFNLPNVHDYLPLGPDFGVSTISPPEGSIGRTVAELDLGHAGAFLVAVQRGSDVLIQPRADLRLQADDLLVLAAADVSLARICGR
jgi:trk system potassium uptake protein